MFAPHSKQNLLPGSSGAPHSGHIVTALDALSGC